MNRALRAAVVGALLLSPVALSACSAGQVAQTATQQRDKVGGSAAAGDITVRDARLAYPSDGEHAAGSDPRLVLAISNSGQEADTLLDISGDGFASAELTGAAPAAGGSAGSGLDLEIPPQTNVFIGDGGPGVALTDLDEPLTSGHSLTVTMRFERAGDVEVIVPVGTPTRELPRGEPFDFHEGGEGAGSDHGGGSSE